MKKISLLAFVSFFSVIAFAQTGKIAAAAPKSTTVSASPKTTTATVAPTATGKNLPIVANAQTPPNVVAFRKASETAKTTTAPKTDAVAPQKHAAQNKQQAIQQQKINNRPSFTSKSTQAVKS